MLIRMGGISLRRQRDTAFLRDWLPLVRADLTATETYRPAGIRPLRCRLSVWAGTHDWYAPVHAVLRWDEASTHPVQRRIFPGGHFFLPGAAAVVPILLAELGWSHDGAVAGAASRGSAA